MPNRRRRYPRQRILAPILNDEAKQGQNVGSALTTRLALAHRLDSSFISKTRQTFVDSVRILSLLSKQQAHDDIDDGQDILDDVCADGAGDDIQGEGEGKSDDEDGDLDWWDKTLEERQAHDKGSLQLTLARLRNHFLDRLSEVLARTKDQPKAVKQMSSAYLEEVGGNSSSQRVEIRVSKNEGFSNQDQEHLKAPSDCLEKIAAGGMISVENRLLFC